MNKSELNKQLNKQKWIIKNEPNTKQNKQKSNKMNLKKNH